MSAVSTNTGFIKPRNFYGYKAGNVNYPVDVSAYLLDGTATTPNPYNANSTAGVQIKGLENFNVVPHLYFDAGNNGGGSADWGTTNTEIKKSFLGMMGKEEGTLTNCPTGPSAPKMGMSFAFRAVSSPVDNIPVALYKFSAGSIPYVSILLPNCCNILCGFAFLKKSN